MKKLKEIQNYKNKKKHVTIILRKQNYKIIKLKNVKYKNSKIKKSKIIKIYNFLIAKL